MSLNSRYVQVGGRIRAGSHNAVVDDLNRLANPRLPVGGQPRWLFESNYGRQSTLLGAVQTDFQTGTQISVKACDANGVTSGDAFDCYVYAGGGSADLTAVTVANAAATATCKLAAGKIIAYAYSGGVPYLLGDVAQVLKDWWVDADTLKVVYAIYWRFGLAVSTVSNVTGPDVLKSKRIDCVTGQVSDGGSSAASVSLPPLPARPTTAVLAGSTATRY
jgi:hypothetical protein